MLGIVSIRRKEANKIEVLSFTAAGDNYGGAGQGFPMSPE